MLCSRSSVQEKCQDQVYKRNDGIHLQVNEAAGVFYEKV